MPEATRARTEARLERIRTVLAGRQKDLTLVVDNVWDPHNVAAILRSCDAFGLLRVHLYYTREKFPEMSRRTSGSAKKWIERVRWKEPGPMLESLRGQGLHVLRTGFTAQAKPLHAWNMAEPCAVILSNEHNGASPELVELVPDELYIPMQGMVQSFNVSVAAALILYEASRQRMEAPAPPGRHLSDAEQAAMAAEWAKR